MTPTKTSSAKQRLLKSLVCSDAHEQFLRIRGFRLIAGIDEVAADVSSAQSSPPPSSCRNAPTPSPTPVYATPSSSPPPAPVARPPHPLDRAAISIAEIDAATIDRVNILPGHIH